LASSLLGVGTGFSLDVSALLPGNRLVGGLGNLVADLLGDLTTHRLGWGSLTRLLNQVGVELVGNIGERKDEGG